MLSCPFCKFDNADTNRRCDQCGQPLQVWCAISISENELTPIEWPKEYLDEGHRYQLIDSDSGGSIAPTAVRWVLDCQPLADSPLAKFQTVWLDEPVPSPEELTATASLPAVAIPYIALQADFFPTIPELHNVIEVDHHTILLIEDRNHWQNLLDAWFAPRLNPLQKIQWLFELTLLWEALVPWNAQKTLLNPAYLKLDGHDLLCLRQLEVSSDLPDTSLQQLGELLLTHFVTSETPPASQLQTLSNDLANGRILQLEDLKQRLADLANQEHQATTSNSSIPPQAFPVANAEEAANSQPIHQATMEPDDATLDTAIVDTSSSTLPDLPTMVLPMKLAQLDEAGISHVGQQRNHNEDYFFAHIKSDKVNDLNGMSLNAKGVFILCDGMGGHACGEVASQLAVSTLRHYFEQHWPSDDALPDETTLTQAVIEANQAIFDINQSNDSSGSGRMGTTLVMLLICNLTAVVVHVGDSRLYSYTKRSGLQQITVDHEVGQREIGRGVEPAIAYARPDAYQLTQALGPRRSKDIRPSINFLELTEDTLFILCSDGLSDHQLLENYADDYIAPLLSSKANLDDGIAKLVDLANDKNGHDNITAILARLKLKPDMSKMPG
jgi:protein phosphatase